MDFNLPQEFLDEMRGAMQDGTRIELPFPAPTVWWLTGDLRNRQIGDAPYFGGWAITADELDDKAAAAGLGLPSSFTRRTLVNREGQEYEAYTARSIAVAVIAKRKRWVVSDSGAGRSQVNILAYMGIPGEKRQLVPWGPVVLSGKSYSGKAIEDSLRQFETATASARRTAAKNMPAWFFYAILGTFEKAPRTEKRGKEGTQSNITPCAVYLPDLVTPEHLPAWYVGPEIAKLMLACKRDAAPWLDDWKEKPEGAAQQSDGYEPPMNGEPTDEAPF